MAWRGCNLSVASHQRRVERFGQGQINAVVRREIPAKLPDASEKHVVRVPGQREIEEIIKSALAASGRDETGGDIASEDLNYFHIEQVRNVQTCRL